MDQNQNSINLILVEDDEGHAELLKMNIRSEYHAGDVIHFSNGDLLVDFLSTRSSSSCEKYIILMDINMPGLSGIQLLKQLKTNAVLREIPVLMFTTSENEKEVAQCYSSGCNLYLAKPADYRAMVRLIQSLSNLLVSTRLPGIAPA